MDMPSLAMIVYHFLGVSSRRLRMNVNQFKKEICPFCDSEMKIGKAEKTSKIDVVLYFKCECDWEEIVSLDVRKVNFENLINGVEYINEKNI